MLVSDLLLEDRDFPEGWARMRDHPVGSLTDASINHVYRSWWDREQGEGITEQAIWRAYSIEDAMRKYQELLQNPLLTARYTPSPDEYYIEFKIPSDIVYKSLLADESLIACGRRIWEFCDVIIRYKNYIVEIRIDLETNYGGYISHGLTNDEIERVLAAVDGKFAFFFSSYPAPSQ